MISLQDPAQDLETTGTSFPLLLLEHSVHMVQRLNLCGMVEITRKYSKLGKMSSQLIDIDLNRPSYLIHY